MLSIRLNVTVIYEFDSKSSVSHKFPPVKCKLTSLCRLELQRYK